MPVEFKTARVITPSATHYDVKFVFHRGSVAIWASDINAWTATRLALETNATFTKRTTARQPHIVILESGEEWQVWPLHTGGCGSCTPWPLSHVSRDDLLDPDYTFSQPHP